MCNLYKITTNVEALVQLVQSFNRPNLPELGEVYPNYEAPIFRKGADGIELTMLKWGVPLPMKDGKRPKPVTNVRNTSSPFWRSMLANPERRCLVPATAFSEWTAEPDPATGKKKIVWFDVKGADLFAFAGIWRPTEDGERFAFLTRAQRTRRTDPPESHAGDPRARRLRPLAHRRLGGRLRAAEALSGRADADRRGCMTDNPLLVVVAIAAVAGAGWAGWELASPPVRAGPGLRRGAGSVRMSFADAS